MIRLDGLMGAAVPAAHTGLPDWIFGVIWPTAHADMCHATVHRVFAVA